MKYFIHLAYKGTFYRGWQRQLHTVSIQQTLEDTLTKMIGQPTICVGCGRTDAGVHARQFFCHITVEKNFEYDPVERLNRMLPNDISIYDFIPVPPQAHAQYDAIARTYEYYIHGKKNAFLSDGSAYYVFENLDIATMKQATSLLLQYPDFRAFCKQPDVYKHTICKVSEAMLNHQKTAHGLLFSITADRFLRGMIRLLVGNMLAVGYGRMTLEAFEHCLATGESPRFYQAAHPQGLYLTKVVYPYLVIPHTFPNLAP